MGTFTCRPIRKFRRVHAGKRSPLWLAVSAFCAAQGFAAGTWTKLAHSAPDNYGGQMNLLSDGTVMAKSTSGGNGTGSIWDRLTPDSHGSYVNGTFSTTIPAMLNTRTDFSSQVLMDGRLYVAGGEYGTGGTAAEVYDPRTNSWTSTPKPAYLVSDAISEILPDGRVLQAFLGGGQKVTTLYDPKTNTYSQGPASFGSSNEASWVKLPDSSILMVPKLSTRSERYIPSLNKWVLDGTVPVQLFDPYGAETGAGFLLPDGRAFFLGSIGTTAYYTPSGGLNPGSWAEGPQIPNGQGPPDAPAAMMVNGKILCAVSPIPTSANHFPTPTSYYEFDYRTNGFTRINAPTGGTTVNGGTFLGNMLDLPDGKVLYSQQGWRDFYVYTPDGSPLASGKPAIRNITHGGSNCDSGYTLTGTLFNGISEGAGYGDDEQMNTNYPIARLTSEGNTYYVRTFNWNSTGVQRGASPDTTRFTLPKGAPRTTFAMVVTANGIASDPVAFTPSCVVPTAVSAGRDASGKSDLQGLTASVFQSTLNLHFQPAQDESAQGGSTLQLARPDGTVVYRESISGSGAFDRKIDLSGHGKGIYLFVLGNNQRRISRRIAVQ